MATLPNPLPRLTSLGLDLPPGEVIESDGPLLWRADDEATPGTWAKYGDAPRSVGLLPVLLDGDPQDWDLAPEDMSYPGDHDPEEVLADLWDECCAEEAGDWPGLAEATDRDRDPESVAAEIADALDGTRLALVPARRSADIPATLGWLGPVNHTADTAGLSAVLRSWEDRFGIRVVALGFDTLTVSVAAPPTTLAEAQALAAEHFAFCPDNLWQSSATTTLESYAEQRVLNRSAWHFWWD